MARRGKSLRPIPQSVSSTPWRILVTDDDPDMRDLIATILKGGAYELTLCADAETALVRVRSGTQFDAIISDFMLPGISGLEFVQQLRSEARTRSVPILMISAHTNYAMNDRAKEAGANAFLNKPFTLSQLRSTLASLLKGPTDLPQQSR